MLNNLSLAQSLIFIQIFLLGRNYIGFQSGPFEMFIITRSSPCPMFPITGSNGIYKILGHFIIKHIHLGKIPLKLRPLPIAYLFIIPPNRSDLSYGPGRFGISGLIFGPEIPMATLISCKLLLNISIYLYIAKEI